MAVQYFTSFLLAVTVSAAVRLTNAQSCGGVTFTITRNDNPICYSVSQDITCTVSGMVAASMRWQLLGGDVPTTVEESTGVNTVTMQVRCSASEFRCSAVDSSGNSCMKDIVVTAKDPSSSLELEHSLNITPSINGTVLAGTTLTLTCVAVVGRVPTLKWIGPNGEPVTSGNGIVVSQQDNIVNLTFNGVRTSQAGNYSCSSELQQPYSLAEDQYCLEVKIPPPNVEVGRSPNASVELFTTDPLSLTCKYSMDPTVDISISSTVTWTGSSSLSDSPRVTHVGSGVEFSSLMSSDGAVYTCCVLLISGTLKVMSSVKVCDSLLISITPRVLLDIHYNSTLECCDNPPFYQPGTSITLTCTAQQVTGTVSYEWTSTGSESFVNGATSSSISKMMLSSADNGTHTCTATDADGNVGSVSTVMIIKGIGMHMLHSEYISGQFLPNNSIVMPKSIPCVSCTLNFFCFSDAPTGTAYVRFPDGSRTSASNNYLNMVVKQQSGATGINVYNFKSYKPQLYGVYTCILPDLLGSMLHYSVTVHTKLPGPPRVYSTDYTDLVYVSGTDALMEVTCSTSDSPPTEVQCSCDGELIDFCGDDFDLVQVVTNRRNVYYDNIVVVKDVTKVAGKHVYQCNISNSQGSDTCVVKTNIPVYESTTITKKGNATLLCSDQLQDKKRKEVTLQCSVQLRGKLRSLLPYIKLEWLGPSRIPLVKSNGFIIGQQQFSSQGTSLDLVLYPLGTQHKGWYTCISSIAIPSLIPFFFITMRYKMIVQCVDYFQLKFGPVSHCSTWHKNEGYIEHIESDIKTALVSAINSRCNCGFTASAIDQGEFTCRYTGQDVIYRARITGTVYTSPELLQMIDAWINTEGSFLSTYDGRIRLWFDPTPPLHITSFYEPEPTNIQERE